MRIAVVGGGIAGLAAAWSAVEGGHDVTLYEAGDRLGGKIRTSEFNGQAVEEGADAFLARVPEAAALARAAGLGDDLISPATGQASFWSRGRLRPIPAGLVLGVPADIGPLKGTGLLSPKGFLRAALEPWLPGRPLTGDEAVGAVIARRFGREVDERLVDPLVGGINAGRTTELSIDVVAAQLAAVARRSRSLSAGLREQRAQAPAAPPGPVFYSVAGGLGRFIDALGHGLADRGAKVMTETAVDSLDDLDADAVVIALPASVAASLLAPVAPETAAGLRAIDHASVGLLTLAYPDSAFVRPPEGSGFLVPRPEGRLLSAATWFDNKWPHLARPGVRLVRASVGRIDDRRFLDLDDETLVGRVHAELAQAAGIRGDGPDAVRVVRYVNGFPQFRPGHLATMKNLIDGLPQHLAIAGAAVRGVGIPACILSGQDAVTRLTPAGAGVSEK